MPPHGGERERERAHERERECVLSCFVLEERKTILRFVLKR